MSDAREPSPGAVLPEGHAAAEKEQLVLQDLARDEWILFARRVHPIVHDAIMDAAMRDGIAPKRGHDIITPQEAVHLVVQAAGVDLFSVLTRKLLILRMAGGAKKASLPIPSYVYCTKIHSCFHSAKAHQQRSLPHL